MLKISDFSLKSVVIGKDYRRKSHPSKKLVVMSENLNFDCNIFYLRERKYNFKNVLICFSPKADELTGQFLLKVFQQNSVQSCKKWQSQSTIVINCSKDKIVSIETLKNCKQIIDFVSYFPVLKLKLVDPLALQKAKVNFFLQYSISWAEAARAPRAVPKIYLRQKTFDPATSVKADFTLDWLV